MRRRVVYVLLGLVALLAAGVLRTLWVAGAFTRVRPHFAGSCRTIEGPVGVEDITIDPRRPLAYLSSANRRAMLAGRPAQGAILTLDLERPGARPVPRTPEMPIDFSPHGISLYPDAGGRDVLFVVDHARGEQAVDLFDVVGDRLVLRRRVSDPLLVSPNDVLGVGRDRFYVTNDHGSRGGWMRLAEDYLRVPLSNVLYYDGHRFRVVARRLRMANGIQMSRDGRTVYVAAVLDRSIRVYSRDPATGDLTLRTRIFLGTGPDNMELDERGRLWVGAHPKLLDFLAHAADSERRAPAQVLRVTPLGSDRFRVEEIYASLGDPISAVSVAAVRGRRMLLGAVFDLRILDCQLAADSP